jgi:iron-sulfur cluster assembly protein
MEAQVMASLLKINQDNSEIITLTPAADQKLHEKNNEKYIRIGVIGGGCSGLQYSLNFTSEKHDDDIEEQHDLCTTIVDPISVMYLRGVVIDFCDTGFQSGFVFRNPNVSAQCGCGQSFSI